MTKREEVRNRQSGQAVILAVVFFLAITTTISFGVLNPVIRQVKQAGDFTNTRASLYASQAVNEDALYRITTGKQFVSPSIIVLNGFSAVATSTAVLGGLEITSTGNAFNLLRKVKTHLSSGSGVSFHYGMQSGQGGINLANTSTIVGNVYSNGPVTGSNSNMVKGTVVSAGPSGLISGVHATSTAYAHTIQNADIDGDAYYQSISGSTVAGTSYPSSPDQELSSLPITDEMITEWENEAAAGGTQSSGCSYSGSTSVTLGPKKLNCDLSLSGSVALTLTGPVWVVGDVTVSNSATIRAASSLGNKSAVLIADNPNNRNSDGRITLSNFTEYYGSGDPNSYLVLISQNNNAESGGGNSAITISNSAGGKLLLYAPHGLIQLSNSIHLKEVTAYKIRMS
ncbi:MAG: hypothetical protein NUV54_00625, partial [Candidatus Taylorbacteria bacterium]|nr:hypothetical protein [Candidatus Taylorbacteria bacterium]